MDKHINCASLINWIKTQVNPYGKPTQKDAYGFGLDVIQYIENAHADVVPVVRCEDCKSYNGHRYCYYHADPVDDNDFCSYGERKNDNDV